MKQNWLKFQFPREFCWDPESFDIVFIPLNPSVPLPFLGLFFFFRNHPNSGNEWTRFPPTPPKKYYFNWRNFVGIFFLGINELFPNVGIHEEKKTGEEKSPEPTPKNSTRERNGNFSIKSNGIEGIPCWWHLPVQAWNEKKTPNSKIPTQFPHLSSSHPYGKHPKIRIQLGIPGVLIQQIPVWKTRLLFFFFLN